MNTLSLKVGARSSPLSQAQVKEVLAELQHYYPQIAFEPLFVASTGDKDLSTSLRALDKTDFFTKEIDELVLSGTCDLGIHSAKDLPDPLPQGLTLAALTTGIDPSDALVMRPGDTLDTLPSGAVIATSSFRREEAVRKMRVDLTYTDIRGNISQRLSKLEDRSADGIVVAEAALIRLGLTHLNRVRIPGETVPYQGQLAILIRSDHPFLIDLLGCIDSRKKGENTILHTGLHPIKRENAKVIHSPLIRIEPRPLTNSSIQKTYQELPSFTHLLFTSQSAVSIFFDYLHKFKFDPSELHQKKFFAVGKATARKIEEQGFHVDLIASEESSEGLVDEFEKIDLSDAYILWPHSALSRDILATYFTHKNIRYSAPIFYDTFPNTSQILPDLKKIDEIVFSSPSSIDAFISFYGSLPQDKVMTCIGLITKRYLSQQE